MNAVSKDSMEQMLWPEKRATDSTLGKKFLAVIDRTMTRSYMRVPLGFQPNLLRTLGASVRTLP
jgi:hypothetical protein